VAVTVTGAWDNEKDSGVEVDSPLTVDSEHWTAMPGIASLALLAASSEQRAASSEPWSSGQFSRAIATAAHCECELLVGTSCTTSAC